jgi:hypothetical protein
MPNFQNSKIYKLWSPSQNLVYYGSTVQPLYQRFNEHKCRYKHYTENNNYCAYVTSFKIMKCADCKMELLEDYPCDNKQQLLKKEAEYVKNNECVNKEIPGRTKQEWEQTNKELIKIKRRERYFKYGY